MKGDFPQFHVINIFNAFPCCGSLLRSRTRSKVGVMSRHLGRAMSAHEQGDVSDRNGVDHLADTAPSTWRAIPLRQRRNGVGTAHKVNPRTVMQNVSFSSSVHTAKLHHSAFGKSQSLAERSEVLLDQTSVEPVMTGGYRRMCREDHLTRNSRHGFVE